MKRSKIRSKQLPYPIFSSFEAAVVKAFDIKIESPSLQQKYINKMN